MNYTKGKFLSVTNTDAWRALMNNGAGTLSAAANWASANRAFYIPLSLSQDMIVTKVMLPLGGTVAGNFDIGAYTLPGLVRVFSTGSTSVGSTANIELYTTLTNPAVLTRGNYFMAVACSSGTNQVVRYASGSTVGMLLARIMQQDTAFPLPSTATPVALSSDFEPYFAFIGV
jgi:hypothetical protein